MSPASAAVAIAVIAAYGLFSRRLAGTWLTMPTFLTAAGLILGPLALGIVDERATALPLEIIVEVTLSLILFTDAVRIDLTAPRSQASLPARLLGIGLPLTIGLGALLAAPFFPGASLAMLLLIGAILAPTDAALGEPVVADQVVPRRIRQALNVESGLNDGLAVPAVLVLSELLVAESVGRPFRDLVSAMAEQIGFGLIAGIVSGAGLGLALRAATSARAISASWRRLVVLGTPLLAIALASLLGGSSFIAAYAAGVAFGLAGRDRTSETTALADEAGEGLNAATWFLFGSVLLSQALPDVTWAMAGYAVLSLTVVRMVPVALALIGTGLQRQTIAFVGWFGPRGLASIAFALLVIDEHVPDSGTVFGVVCLTVALSAAAHGATAAIGARRYGAWYAAQPRPPTEEAVPVHDHRVRGARSDEPNPAG